MSEAEISIAEDGTVQGGPFVLSGKVEKPDPTRIPVKGDLAHIALAGHYFVPHYVVPLVRMAGDSGASLLAKPDQGSEIVDGLAPGERFDVLDIEGNWAWGCVPKEGGAVGFVSVDDLLDPFA